MSLLSCRQLSHRYGGGWFTGLSAHAVLHEVSLSIGEGESVALLGASGSGKSTLARLLLGLETPFSGDVLYQGRPLSRLDAAGLHRFRAGVQIVFQDSHGAVNPRFPVGRIIAEPLRFLTTLDAPARQARTIELLRAVGLSAAEADRRPAELSGGQLQRVCLARAMAPRPRLIVLDEAVSNLDIPLQAQILDLMSRLRVETGVSFLFISHDLRQAARFCSRAVVMERGRIVEDGPFGSFSSEAGRRLAAALPPRRPSPSPSLMPLPGPQPNPA